MITLEKIKYNLIKAIEQSNLSQSEIARRIGVQPQTVHGYLNRNTLPSLEILANLCAVLGVSANEILCIKKNDNLS